MWFCGAAAAVADLVQSAHIHCAGTLHMARGSGAANEPIDKPTVMGRV